MGCWKDLMFRESHVNLCVVIAWLELISCLQLLKFQEIHSSLHGLLDFLLLFFGFESLANF